MTVICFDGRTIASDGLRSGDLRDVWDDRPKFSVVRPGVIVASAGDVAWSEAFDTWASSPRRKYPKAVENRQTSEAAVFRKRDGVWRKHFSDTERPERIGVAFTLGSGATCAATAMVLGHDAIAACWAAMQLEPTCGGSIFAAELSELLKHGNAAIKRCDYQAGPARTRPGIQSVLYSARP